MILIEVIKLIVDINGLLHFLWNLNGWLASKHFQDERRSKGNNMIFQQTLLLRNCTYCQTPDTGFVGLVILNECNIFLIGRNAILIIAVNNFNHLYASDKKFLQLI